MNHLKKGNNFISSLAGSSLRSLLLILVTFLTSCIILIGENDYRALSDSSKNRISIVEGDLPESRDSAILLYEVKAGQLLEAFRKDSYNVVRFWRPYCENDHCRDVSAEQALADSFDIQMYLICETYDLEQIEQILRTSDYKLPVFVPWDGFYGHKLTATRKQFFAELTGEESMELVFMDYLLFKGDQLLCCDKTIEDIKYYLNNK